MRDPNEFDSPATRPTGASGLTFVGLLAGAVLAAVLLGQVADPGPLPRPPTVAAPTNASDLSTTHEPDVPMGGESLKPCPVQVGGLTLGDHLQVPGTALERWDCDAPTGPWSVVIRAAAGHFGVKSAVVTFPIDHAGSAVPSTRLHGGMWNPGVQRLTWPLGGSFAQIVGDFGLATLENLARRVTVEAGKPHLAVADGFIAAATTTFNSPVVHEMRYGTSDLGQEGKLGDGLVYTGVMLGASFESLAFEDHAKPAGFVRGKPAIFSEGLGGDGTLAWEPAPGEVAYIGFSGPATRAVLAIETLRALADMGRRLTPAQWETKDPYPVTVSSG
jgi:fluoride ion exporter CrcB/FEX